MLSKTIGGMVAIAAVLALSASTIQAQQNLLVNGDFEYAGLNTGDGIDHGTPYAGGALGGSFTVNPITLTSGPAGASGVNQGWALFGAVSQSDMSSSADSPYSGSYALLEQNAPGNNWDPAGAYQIVNPSGGVQIGATYTFSIWFLTDTGTSYGTPVDLQIGFEDANPTDPVLGGGTTSWGFGSPTANAGAIPANDKWIQGSVSATAPAGAVNVIVYAMFMDNGQTVTENVYFDDGVLSVPEPTSLALVGMGLAAIPIYLIRRRKV